MKFYLVAIGVIVLVGVGIYLAAVFYCLENFTLWSHAACWALGG